MRLKSNKSRSRTAEARKQRLLSLLQQHGLGIYENLDQGKFPQFVIPSRSVSNIVYDKKIRQYILGNGSAVRSSRNMSQLRSYTQLAWLSFFVNRLVREGK